MKNTEPESRYRKLHWCMTVSASFREPGLQHETARILCRQPLLEEQPFHLCCFCGGAALFLAPRQTLLAVCVLCSVHATLPSVRLQLVRELLQQENLVSNVLSWPEYLQKTHDSSILTCFRDVYHQSDEPWIQISSPSLGSHRTSHGT